MGLGQEVVVEVAVGEVMVQDVVEDGPKEQDKAQIGRPLESPHPPLTRLCEAVVVAAA